MDSEGHCEGHARQFHLLCRMVALNHPLSCDVEPATSKVQQRLSACKAFETRGLLLDLYDPLRHVLGGRHYVPVRHWLLQHLVPRLELIPSLAMGHDNNNAHMERWPLLVGSPGHA